MPAKLVVMVGPDRFHMEPARLNDFEHPHEIRSEHFVGRVLIRILDAPGAREGEPGFEYFRDRSRRFAIQIEGRFTRPWRGSEIHFGTDLDRLIDFPRRPFNAGMAIARMIDPCVFYEERPPSGRPFIMSPYCACMNILCAWPAPARAHDAVVVLQDANGPGGVTSNTPSRSGSLDEGSRPNASTPALSVPPSAEHAAPNSVLTADDVEEGDVVPLEALDKTGSEVPKKKKGWLSLGGGTKEERKPKRYWRFLGFIQDPRVRAYLAAHHTSLEALTQQPGQIHSYQQNVLSHSTSLPGPSHAPTSHTSLHSVHAPTHPHSPPNQNQELQPAGHHAHHRQQHRRRKSGSSDAASAPTTTGTTRSSSRRLGPIITGSESGEADSSTSPRLLQQLGLGAHEAGGQTPDPVKMLSLAHNDLYRRLTDSINQQDGNNKLHEIDEEELDALLMTTAPSTPLQSFENLPRSAGRPAEYFPSEMPTVPATSQPAAMAPAGTASDLPSGATTAAQDDQTPRPTHPPLMQPSHVQSDLDRTPSARPSVQIEEPEHEADDHEGKVKRKTRGSKMMGRLSLGHKDKDKHHKSREERSHSRSRRGLGRSLDLSRKSLDHSGRNSVEDHGNELAQILTERENGGGQDSPRRSLSQSFSTSLGFTRPRGGGTGSTPAPAVQEDPSLPSDSVPSVTSTNDFGTAHSPGTESTPTVSGSTEGVPSKELKNKSRSSYTGHLLKKMLVHKPWASDKEVDRVSSTSPVATEVHEPTEHGELALERGKSKHKKHSTHHSISKRHGHQHSYGPRCSARPDAHEQDAHQNEHRDHQHPTEPPAVDEGEERRTSSEHAVQLHGKKSMTDSAARMTSTLARGVVLPGRILKEGVSSIPVPSLPKSRNSSTVVDSDEDDAAAAAATSRAASPEEEKPKSKKRMSLMRKDKEHKDSTDTFEHSAPPKRGFSTRLRRSSKAVVGPARSRSVDVAHRHGKRSVSPNPLKQPLSALLASPGTAKPVSLSPAPLSSAEDKPALEPNNQVEGATTRPQPQAVPSSQPPNPVPLLAHPKPRQGPLQLGAQSDDEDDASPELPSTPGFNRDGVRMTTLPVHQPPLGQVSSEPASTIASEATPASDVAPRSELALAPITTLLTSPSASTSENPPLSAGAAELYQDHPWLAGGTELQPVTSSLMRTMQDGKSGDENEVFRLANRVPRIFAPTPSSEAQMARGTTSPRSSMRRAGTMGRSPSAPPLRPHPPGPSREPVALAPTVDKGASDQSSMNQQITDLVPPRAQTSAPPPLQPTLPPKPSVAERMARESAQRWESTLDADLGPWRFTDPSVDMIEDNTFVLLNKSMTVSERRKYFGNRKHQDDFVYDPDVVYSTAFFSNMMDFNTFDLAIGFVSMNLRRFFRAMPVRYTLRARDDEDICMATISFQIIDEED